MKPNEVTKARHALGLNQWELASTMGVTRRAVQNWEHGTRPIMGPARKLLKLLVALDAAIERHGTGVRS